MTTCGDACDGVGDAHKHDAAAAAAAYWWSHARVVDVAAPPPPSAAETTLQCERAIAHDAAALAACARMPTPAHAATTTAPPRPPLLSWSRPLCRHLPTLRDAVVRMWCEQQSHEREGAATTTTSIIHSNSNNKYMDSKADATATAACDAWTHATPSQRDEVQRHVYTRFLRAALAGLYNVTIADNSDNNSNNNNDNNNDKSDDDADRAARRLSCLVDALLCDMCAAALDATTTTEVEANAATTTTKVADRDADRDAMVWLTGMLPSTVAEQLQAQQQQQQQQQASVSSHLLLMQYADAFVLHTLHMHAHERAHFLPRWCGAAHDALSRQLDHMACTARQLSKATTTTTMSDTLRDYTAYVHVCIDVMHGLVRGLTRQVHSADDVDDDNDDSDSDRDARVLRRRYWRCVSMLVPMTRYADARRLCDALDAWLTSLRTLMLSSSSASCSVSMQQRDTARLRALVLRLQPLFASSSSSSSLLLLPRFADVVTRAFFVGSDNDDDDDDTMAWRACLCALQAHTRDARDDASRCNKHSGDDNDNNDNDDDDKATTLMYSLLQQPLPTLSRLYATRLQPTCTRVVRTSSVDAVVAERGDANARRAHVYAVHKQQQQEQEQAQNTDGDVTTCSNDNDDDNSNGSDDRLSVATLFFARYVAVFASLDAAMQRAMTAMHDAAAADDGDGTTRQQRQRTLTCYVSAALEHALVTRLDTASSRDVGTRSDHAPCDKLTDAATTRTTTTATNATNTMATATCDVAAGELLAFFALLVCTPTTTTTATTTLPCLRAALTRFLGDTWASVVRYVHTTLLRRAHAHVGVVAALLLPPLRVLGLDEHAWASTTHDKDNDDGDNVHTSAVRATTAGASTASRVGSDVYTTCAGGLPFPLGVLTTFVHELPRVCYARSVRRLASCRGAIVEETLHFLLQCCGRDDDGEDGEDVGSDRNEGEHAVDEDGSDSGMAHMVALVTAALRVVVAQHATAATSSSRRSNNSSSGDKQNTTTTTTNTSPTSPTTTTASLLSSSMLGGDDDNDDGGATCACVDAALALAYGLRRLCSMDVSTTTTASDWRHTLRSRLVPSSSSTTQRLLVRVVRCYRVVWQRALVQLRRTLPLATTSQRDVYMAAMPHLLSLPTNNDDNDNDDDTMCDGHWLRWFRQLPCDAFDAHAVRAAKALLRDCSVHYAAHVCTRTLLDIRADLEHYAATHSAVDATTTTSAMAATLPCTHDSGNDALAAMQAALVRDLTALQRQQQQCAATPAPDDEDNNNDNNNNNVDNNSENNTTTTTQARLRAYADALCAALVVRACASPADGACAGNVLRVLVQTAAHVPRLPLVDDDNNDDHKKAEDANSNHNDNNNDNNNNIREVLTTGLVRRVVRAMAARLACATPATVASLAAALHVVVETIVVPYTLSFASTPRAHDTSHDVTGSSSSDNSVTATPSSRSTSATTTATTNVVRTQRPAAQLTPHARDAGEVLRSVVADVTRALCALLQVRTPRGDACAYVVALCCRRVLRLLARYDAAWCRALSARTATTATTTSTTAHRGKDVSSSNAARESSSLLWLTRLRHIERPLLPGMTAPAASAHDLYTPAPAATTTTTATTTMATRATATTTAATTTAAAPQSPPRRVSTRDVGKQHDKSNNNNDSNSSSSHNSRVPRLPLSSHQQQQQSQSSSSSLRSAERDVHATRSRHVSAAAAAASSSSSSSSRARTYHDRVYSSSSSYDNNSSRRDRHDDSNSRHDNSSNNTGYYKRSRYHDMRDGGGGVTNERSDGRRDAHDRHHRSQRSRHDDEQRRRARQE